MLKTLVVSIAVAGALFAGTAQASEMDVGKSLYARFCASCHGPSGKGDGTMPHYLTEIYADLTVLAAKNGGEFPMTRVLHIIDGRTGLRGHGGSMPVFGDVFSTENPEVQGSYTGILETRGRILSLAQYLESIQQ